MTLILIAIFLTLPTIILVAAVLATLSKGSK